jgi:uncharacterized protein YyaL (SSP411 family)
MPDPPDGKNRLAFETSPYLLQHAENPVDWYPWGEAAFAKAKAEDKPILVSIGYSSCHWCHVMEHESFENADIAKLMNELFVCVKVDREERPDVDEIYMTSIHMMGQQGGWPLNVFLTPDGRPFFGGTYFPPSTRYGRMGWPELLRSVAELWKTKREEIGEQAGELTKALQDLSSYAAGDALPEAKVFQHAADLVTSQYDARNGGFGAAPKFPPHQTLELLLRRQIRSGNRREREIVDHTLRAMAKGGMYDQVGGGFHRYSVDEKWLIPHFEKMLYDNAQLAKVYVEAYQLTRDAFHARIAREVLDYVLREMTGEKGGFYSATDADSEGREGKFFVWTKDEIDSLLGEDAMVFCRAYGVTVEGNFEDPHHPPAAGDKGQNVLHVVYTAEEVAKQEGLPAAEVARRLESGRRVLFEARRKRVPPGLDDKVLVSWNGLMIGALAYAGRVLGEPRYVKAARRAAEFILRDMRAKDGSLMRTWRGGQAKIPALLEDYAALTDALLDLYEATFDLRWLREAKALAEEMNRRFADEERGGWYHTEANAADLVTRIKTPTDSSTPGPNAVAARALIRLGALTGDAIGPRRAEKALQLFRGTMERAPTAAMGLLLALDLLLHEDGEIAIVGDPEKESTKALLRSVNEAFLPATLLALRHPNAGPEEEEMIPLLRGKTLVGGAEAAYVCENYACKAPVTTPAELEKMLASR